MNDYKVTDSCGGQYRVMADYIVQSNNVIKIYIRHKFKRNELHSVFLSPISVRLIEAGDK